jgi:hypothetical protein
VKHFAAAPLSLVWLVVLSVTTRIQQSAGRRQLRRIERENSTNLRRLRREPLRVLVTSLLWVDEGKWLAAFAGVRNGGRTGRTQIALVALDFGWLCGARRRHVCEPGVRAAVDKRNRAPRRLENARDVGVSYFVFGWVARCRATSSRAGAPDARLQSWPR